MVLREIIKIDEDLCTGCGLCIPNCPEGALQIIDDKARVISDIFCDGLGACIGHCPEGAIEVIKREAEPYDERKVMANVVKQGPNVIKAHLEHMNDHGEMEYLRQAIDYLKENGYDVPELGEKEEQQACPSTEQVDMAHAVPEACPSTVMRDLTPQKAEPLACGCPSTLMQDVEHDGPPPAQTFELRSQLSNFPFQLHLVPPQAPFLKNANLAIIADCVAYAHAMAHEKFIKGKKLLIGCPKLDDRDAYVEKISEIIKVADLKSLTLVHMEVPCCFGFRGIIEEAIAKSGKPMGYRQVVVSIKGEVMA